MKKDETMFLSDEIVFNLIVSNYLPEDHATICSIAETNKWSKKHILLTASDRKQKLFSDIGNCLGHFTHIYGSASYWVRRHLDQSNVLVLRYRQFKDEKIQQESTEFTGFISPLYHKPKPFIDKNRIVYFFGYGSYKYRKYMYKNNEYENREQDGILMYCSDGSRRVCHGRYGTKGESFDLSYFLFYPFLLEAILAACSTNEELKFHINDPIPLAIHCLDSTTIPDNYKERMMFSTGKDRQQRDLFGCWRAQEVFKNLPEYIKEAIEKRHQECCDQDSTNQ